MNKISINNFSDVEIEILRKLNEYGKGYIVGGAIRDILLGLEPKDIDFTTNLPYETLKDLFKECNPKETGKSFGVLRIRPKILLPLLSNISKPTDIIPPYHKPSLTRNVLLAS